MVLCQGLTPILLFISYKDYYQHPQSPRQLLELWTLWLLHGSRPNRVVALHGFAAYLCIPLIINAFIFNMQYSI
mgnify:CR=1 FL=1